MTAGWDGQVMIWEESDDGFGLADLLEAKL